MESSRAKLRLFHGGICVTLFFFAPRSYMANFVSLNGIGAGPCETIMPQIIADLIFLHNRGKYQTLYFTAYFSSLMVSLPLTPSSARTNIIA